MINLVLAKRKEEEEEEETSQCCLLLLYQPKPISADEPPSAGQKFFQALITDLNNLLKSPSIPKWSLAQCVPLALLPLYLLVSHRIGERASPGSDSLLSAPAPH